MFVNISPADYNGEETQMSLYYASRAKQIVNENKKNVEAVDMAKIKEQMKHLIEENDKLKKQAMIKGGNGSDYFFSDNSAHTTPLKSDHDFNEDKYDEGPINKISINESFK